MASIAQQAASRANGARSAGPTSEAGKRITSQNATRHGLSATATAPETVVVWDENQSDYDRRLAGLIAVWQPSNQMELDLVERLAAAQWRLRRAQRMEAAVMNAQRLEVDTVSGDVNDLGFDAGLMASLPTLAMLHRYEARLMRDYHACVKLLVQIQKERQALEALEAMNMMEANLLHRLKMDWQAGEAFEEAFCHLDAPKPSHSPTRPQPAGDETNPSRLDKTPGRHSPPSLPPRPTDSPNTGPSARQA